MGKTLICLLLFLCTLFAHAQTTGTISGKVTDTEGNPLNSVHIVLKGTHPEGPNGLLWRVPLGKGVVTDVNGVYLLEGLVPGEHILMASYISYKTKSKSVVVRENETLEVDFSLEEDDLNLDQVVVSASRTPEKLSEIPASITVVDYKKLKSLATNTTDMSEILAIAVPGLAPNTGTFSNWGQTLRGRKLLVMVDGIPQSTPLRNGQVGIAGVQPGAIESIEVVKGSTSIYGNGADGGFINYITRTPDKGSPLSGSTNLWGTINPAYTDKSLGWGVQQSLTGGLDKLSYYISASYEKTGTLYDSKGSIISPTYGLDNTEIISTLAKVGYQIADNQSIDLMFNTYQTRQQTPYVPQIGKVKATDASGNRLITPTIGVFPTADNPLQGGPGGVTNQNLHLKYTWEGIFRGSTRFGTDVYYQKNKNIFFYSPILGKNGGQSVINSAKFGIRPIFNTELTLNSPLRVSFTYGLDVLHDRTNQGLLDGQIWVPNLNLLSIAPFLQARFKFKDDWVVKAGVRHDDMKVNIESFSTLPTLNRRTGKHNASVNVTGGELSFNNTAYNAGIRYIKHDEFVPYINYSEGFLLPDIGGIMRSATSKTNVANLNPEAIRVNNYEFGFLSSFGHVRFEAVGYYSTSNLAQSLKLVESTGLLMQSKSPQTIFGAEASLDFSFFDNNLLFGGSYSYVEGLQHTANNPYNLTYIGGDLIAPPKITAHVTVKPTEKLTTSIRYLRVENRKRFAPTKKSDGSYTYKSRQVPVTGYGVVNLSANYRATEKLSVSLGINNLFNNYYLPARSQWAAPFNYNSAGQGINSRFSLTYNF